MYGNLPTGGFHKWKYPQDGWFTIDNPIKMDDLEVSPLSGNLLNRGFHKWGYP